MSASDRRSEDRTGRRVSRRSMLKNGAAALAGGAALLPGRDLAAAQAAGVQGGGTSNGAGRRFRGWVSRGFGANTTALTDLTLLPIGGRQVLIRTEVTQCCYTMAARMLGTQDPPVFSLRNSAPRINDPNLPTIQGHGGVGVVEAVGPQVRRVQPGDRVMVVVTPQCGQCRHCLRGRADRCQAQINATAVPIATTADGTQVVQAGNIGGMAEVMVAFEESCVPLFTNADSADLAMLHCVGGTGLGTTMTLSPVEPGSNVAVFGAGPVGLSAVQGARIAGAARIVVVEPIRARRDLALKVGATHVFDPNAEGANLVRRIQELCKGPSDRVFGGGRRANFNASGIAAHIGPDFVIEAVGYDRATPKLEAGPDPTGMLQLQQVWDVCPTGGHICTTGVGYPPEATVSFPANQWTNGSKTHHPSQFGGISPLRDIPRFVELLDRGLYDAKSLITTRYPLDKAMDAYRDVVDRTTVTAMIMVS